MQVEVAVVDTMVHQVPLVFMVLFLLVVEEVLVEVELPILLVQ